MTIAIRIFSDFTCPFCYLGSGIIEQIKRDHDLSVEWISFELHPDTPEQGVLLADKFPDYDLDALFDELRIKGSRYGCEFGDITLLSNSRKALEASEFAKDHGKGDQFRRGIFYSYFTKARDIGQIPVILEAAARAGLDRDELLHALREHRYEDRLKKFRSEGRLYSVNTLPTFIFNGREKIVGIRPVEIYKDMIKRIS